MKTLLPIQKVKGVVLARSKEHLRYATKAIMEKRPKERYYSLLVPADEMDSPYITVVRDARNDVLRINMICMSIYECYLFVLGLPSNFPKKQILVYGHDRAKYIPCRSCEYGEKLLYDYELTVPVNTSMEAYLPRILDDMNKHFELDVRVEQLPIVKDSRPIMTKKGESVELIWEEQPMMIMRTKGGLLTELSKNQVAERI